MREEPLEVQVGGGSLVGCAASEGAPALLLHGGPPAPPRNVGLQCSVYTNASMATHFGQRTLEWVLPAVRLPVLIVHGVQSPLPLESLERTAAPIPGAVFERADATGHFPWLEQPGAVRAAVERFL